VEVKKVMLDGEDITPPVDYHGKLRGWTDLPGIDVALVDTGSSGFRIPQEMYDKINEAILHAAPVLQDDPSLNPFITDSVPFPSALFPLLPTLTIILDNNVTLVYTPQDYIQSFPPDNATVAAEWQGKTMYSLVLVPGRSFIFGQVALEKVGGS